MQELLAADTGQSVERITHDINRDYWTSAVEARDYGIIGKTALRLLTKNAPHSGLSRGEASFC
jgi:ATP-dependent protease ClpP protease subunit